MTLVDAIISEDSDSFCYGAEIVLRNFSIAPSGNFVEMFTASRLVGIVNRGNGRLLIRRGRGCTIKHYVSVMYGKWTNFVKS